MVIAATADTIQWGYMKARQVLIAIIAVLAIVGGGAGLVVADHANSAEAEVNCEAIHALRYQVKASFSNRCPGVTLYDTYLLCTYRTTLIRFSLEGHVCLIRYVQ